MSVREISPFLSLEISPIEPGGFLHTHMQRHRDDTVPAACQARLGFAAQPGSLHVTLPVYDW